MSNFKVKSDAQSKLNDEVPKILQKMTYQQRWEWYDGITKQIQKASSEDKPLEMSIDVVKGFNYMMGLKDLKHAMSEANHYNAVVGMACAMIESDPEKSRERLEDYLDIAGEYTWPMYTSADQFFIERYMSFPETVEGHRSSIAKSREITKQARERFAVWQKRRTEGENNK